MSGYEIEAVVDKINWKDQIGTLFHSPMHMKRKGEEVAFKGCTPSDA